MSNQEEIAAAINAKGEDIRLLKAAKPATIKEDLVPLIADLLALKISYKEITGKNIYCMPSWRYYIDINKHWRYYLLSESVFLFDLKILVCFNHFYSRVL